MKTFIGCLGIASAVVLIAHSCRTSVDDPVAPAAFNKGSLYGSLPRSKSREEEAREKVVLKLNNWSKTEFDSIMQADFTVTNDSDRPVKDIEIECRHSANSGTVIDSNKRTLYELIQPHSKRRFRKFDMGFIHSQAAATGCAIKDLVVQ